MNVKLTLNVDQEIITQTKRYAQQRHQSVSALVEQYFRFLLEQTQIPEEPEISPTVQALSGIITLDEASDIHDEYTTYLLEKYQ